MCISHLAALKFEKRVLNNVIRMSKYDVEHWTLDDDVTQIELLEEEHW